MSAYNRTTKPTYGQRAGKTTFPVASSPLTARGFQYYSTAKLGSSAAGVGYFMYSVNSCNPTSFRLRAIPSMMTSGQSIRWLFARGSLIIEGTPSVAAPGPFPAEAAAVGFLPAPELAHAAARPYPSPTDVTPSAPAVDVPPFSVEPEVVFPKKKPNYSLTSASARFYSSSPPFKHTARLGLSPSRRTIRNRKV